MKVPEEAIQNVSITTVPNKNVPTESVLNKNVSNALLTQESFIKRFNNNNNNNNINNNNHNDNNNNNHNNKKFSKTVSFANTVTLVLPPPVTEAAADWTYAKKRADQVIDINTSATREPAIRLAWPEAAPQTCERWNARHSVHLTLSTGHKLAQSRMLWLADVESSQRFIQFEKHCFLRRLAPTTAETYWGSWLGVASILGILAPDDKKVASLLKKRANAYPTKFPLAMTPEHLRCFREMFIRTQPLLVHVVVLAWSCGQRVSDVCLISPNNIVVEGSRLIVKITNGKVLNYIPPYIIAIDLTLGDGMPNPIAQAASCLRHAAERAERKFVFLESLDDGDRDVARQIISEALSMVHPELECRSIRRGGLQHMAKMGIPLQDILLFSQHREESMLLRYLNYGTASLARTNTLAAVSLAMAAAL